jgi:hypothetical protein
MIEGRQRRLHQQGGGQLGKPSRSSSSPYWEPELLLWSNAVPLPPCRRQGGEEFIDPTHYWILDFHIRKISPNSIHGDRDSQSMVTNPNNGFPARS